MNAYNLTEDQAITAVTTVADFGVTQVVDGERSAPDLFVSSLHTLDAFQASVK